MNALVFSKKKPMLAIFFFHVFINMNQRPQPVEENHQAIYEATLVLIPTLHASTNSVVLWTRGLET
jgi:hypothetical protein